MHDPDASPYDPLEIRDVLPVPPPPRGHPVLAWIVIVLGIGVVIGGRGYLAEAEQRAGKVLHKGPDGSVFQRLMGRYYVGAGQLPGANKKDLYRQMTGLDGGSVKQRLQFVTIAGEMSGPEEALDQLRKLKQDLRAYQREPTADEARAQTLLTKLYLDYAAGKWAAPSLQEADRRQLKQELGWFGELALAPADGPDAAARAAVLQPATRTVMAILAAFFLAAALGVVGFIGLVVLGILLLTGNLKRHFQTGQPWGGIYAETFAVWFVLFVALQVGAGLVPAGNNEMLVAAAAFFLSLAALAWPVLRGVPAGEMWRDIGWRGGVGDVALGIPTYVSALPMVAVGLVLTLILMAVDAALQRVFAGPGAPAGDPFAERGLPAAHPVVGILANADWWGLVQIFIVACVAAPIVEETMFRGVLYRHLREASAWLGVVVSFLFSAVVSSFVFAVVHPQGWVAIPLLMALAFAFAIAREWRGSLLPAMIAHGTSNGLVLWLATTILRG